MTPWFSGDFVVDLCAYDSGLEKRAGSAWCHVDQRQKSTEYNKYHSTSKVSAYL